MAKGRVAAGKTARRGVASKGKPAPKKADAGHAVSPLAPKSFATLPPLAGVRLATAEAGVRYKDRTDVLLAVLAPGTQVAGVFTKSKTASAPVEWCRTGLKGGHGAGAGRQQRQRQCLHRQGGSRRRARSGANPPPPWSAARPRKCSWPPPA